MILFLFKGYDNKGNLGEWTFGGPNIESGLDLLTCLTNKGWRLSEIKLLEAKERRMITLPVVIIVGAFFSEPIRRLKREWEDVLV